VARGRKWRGRGENGKGGRRRELNLLSFLHTLILYALQAASLWFSYSPVCLHFSLPPPHLLQFTLPRPPHRYFRLKLAREATLFETVAQRPEAGEQQDPQPVTPRTLMSLFQTKEWWVARAESEEEFGCSAVAVGNLDNNGAGALKVATGSFSGKLRIYSPSGRGYKLEDVVLESALELPILQLSAGRFVADPQRTALAVLHPRKLTIYTISVTATGGSLAKAYEHALERPSCNMCHGPFGGHGKHDFIAVQSMDGSVTLMEQVGTLLKGSLTTGFPQRPQNAGSVRHQ